MWPGPYGIGASKKYIWEMHDLLYENQENLEDDSLFGFAAAVASHQMSSDGRWRPESTGTKSIMTFAEECVRE